jgi:hypothetical protein
MAPERFRGEGDVRADLYALGLTLYELLAGRPAFDDSDRARLIRQVTQEDPPRLRKLSRRVPHDLETIVHKAIAREPGQRYPTAAALAEDLKRFLDGVPIVARPVPFWERAWKWARRRPAIAASLVLAQVSMIAVAAMAIVSNINIHQALDRANLDRIKAIDARGREALAHRKADEARNAALAETYRATVSEVRSLRSAHLPGWRDRALRNLGRLARMPTPRRDLRELRSEAVASLGEIDAVEVARFEANDALGATESLDFSPDSRTLVLARVGGRLDFVDLARWRHAGAVLDPKGVVRESAVPAK